VIVEELGEQLEKERFIVGQCPDIFHSSIRTADGLLLY